MLSVAQNIDYETQQSYNFSVSARTSDNTNEGTASVVVNVLDVNDNAPVFPAVLYHILAFENTTVGNSITSLRATDEDSGTNGDIVYSIIGDQGTFNITADQGTVILAQSLDREAVQSYNVFVQATDGGVPQQHGMTELSIIVGDVNDNPPIFDQSAYTTTIPFDSQAGDKVFTVVAKDIDSGKNADIQYTITGGNEDMLFDIDPQSGVVTLIQSLDNVTGDQFTLVLQAADSGSPPMNTTAKLLITCIGCPTVAFNTATPSLGASATTTESSTKTLQVMWGVMVLLPAISLLLL